MNRYLSLIVLFFHFTIFATICGAATYTVTKTADTNDGACDADCSLREAVAAANGSADNDIIEFGPLFQAPQTITLSGTDIIITNNGTLTVNGTGADKLTVSGAGASRVFTNNTGAVTTINDLRVTLGSGASTVTTGRGGGIYNSGGTLTLNRLIVSFNSAANGGGLNNAGTATLNVNDSVISNNTATGAGGGMQNFGGNFLNVRNTTISGNTCQSTFTGGGGMQANGTLTFTNVTFSGNTATGGDGGAIYYNGQGLNMNNVTIAANTATGGGSGGIHKSTSTLNANIRNSIMAANSGSTSPDAIGAFNSQGTNLIATVGSSTGWVASDLQNQNALLGPLGFCGGKGLTYMPMATSPVLNAGQNCVIDLTCAASNPPTAITTDQRGAARPANTTIDIGAIEVSTAYTVTLPAATVGQAYEFVLSQDNANFLFTVDSLPNGWMLVNTPTQAALEGLPPSQSGTFNFQLTIRSTTAQTVPQNYRVNVISASAFATVGGRAFSETGYGVPNVIVTLTDSSNMTRRARTNGFGYYYFDNVGTGANYTVSAVSKQYSYQPINIFVTDNVSNLDLTPTP